MKVPIEDIELRTAKNSIEMDRIDIHMDEHGYTRTATNWKDNEWKLEYTYTIRVISIEEWEDGAS